MLMIDKMCALLCVRAARVVDVCWALSYRLCVALVVDCVVVVRCAWSVVGLVVRACCMAFGVVRVARCLMWCWLRFVGGCVVGVAC